MLTNHTGLLPDGEHVIDLLNDNPEVELALLFGPEHGLRGEEDNKVASGVDSKNGSTHYFSLRKVTETNSRNVGESRCFGF